MKWRIAANPHIYQAGNSVFFCDLLRNLCLINVLNVFLLFNFPSVDKLISQVACLFQLFPSLWPLLLILWIKVCALGEVSWDLIQFVSLFNILFNLVPPNVWNSVLTGK